MSLPKTYYYQFEDDLGSIHNLTVKARSLSKAQAILEEVYSDTYVPTVSRQKSTNRTTFRVGIFAPNHRHRGGQYIYRHKGRKLRNRKNYPTPKRGWGKQRVPVTFTWIERYDKRARDFIKSWVALNLVPEFRQAPEMPLAQIPGPVILGPKTIVPEQSPIAEFFNARFYERLAPSPESSSAKISIEHSQLPGAAIWSFVDSVDIDFAHLKRVQDAESNNPAPE